MRTRHLFHALTAFAATSLVFACADNTNEPTAEEVGDGDGDGDGEGEATTGDGDGEATTGDGDGEAPGDGDGEAPGDGDGEANECSTNADIIAPEIAQPDGGCTIIVRFDYDNMKPKSWTSTCAPYPDVTLDEDQARKASDCCSDGVLLNAGDDKLFVLFSKPDPEGGVAVVSNHLAKESFEATIGQMDLGMVTFPEKWATPDNLGSGCGAAIPEGTGYDLSMEGAELDPMQLQGVLEAFADTALTQAIEQNGKIRRTLTLVYPPKLEPFDSAEAEYILIIESGTE